jgi:hypothetical protein
VGATTVWIMLRVCVRLEVSLCFAFFAGFKRDSPGYLGDPYGCPRQRRLGGSNPSRHLPYPRLPLSRCRPSGPPASRAAAVKAAAGSLSPLSPVFWGGRGRSGGLELRSPASLAVAAACPPGSGAALAESGGRTAGARVVCCGGGGWCCGWRWSWPVQAAVASGFGGIGRGLLRPAVHGCGRWWAPGGLRPCWIWAMAGQMLVGSRACCAQATGAEVSRRW